VYLRARPSGPHCATLFAASLQLEEIKQRTLNSFHVHRRFVFHSFSIFQVHQFLRPIHFNGKCAADMVAEVYYDNTFSIRAFEFPSTSI